MSTIISYHTYTVCINKIKMPGGSCINDAEQQKRFMLIVPHKVWHLKQSNFDVNICNTTDFVLHGYVEEETGVSLYQVMMADVKIRLMEKDALVFLLHCRPTHMSIIVSGNVMEVLYNTLCVNLKHLLACVLINSNANQQDLLLILFRRLLPYKSRHKQDAFSIIFDKSDKL